MNENSPVEVIDAMSDHESSYLLLHLGDECYMLPGEAVREIARWRAFLPVPGAPPALPGIMSQRGQVLAVVNLHHILGLPETPNERSTRYVIVHHDEVDMALRVDAVTDMVNLGAPQFEAVPGGLDPQRARLLKAITRIDDHPAALIDLGTLVATLRSGA